MIEGCNLYILLVLGLSINLPARKMPLGVNGSYYQSYMDKTLGFCFLGGVLVKFVIFKSLYIGWSRVLEPGLENGHAVEWVCNA